MAHVSTNSLHDFDQQLKIELEHLREDQAQLSVYLDTARTLNQLESDVIAMECWGPREQRLFQHILSQNPLNEFEIATETYHETTKEVALESIGATLKRVWEAIVRMTKRIWDRIMAFFKARDLQAAYIRDRLKRMNHAVSGLDGAVPATQVVQVGTSYYQLGRHGGAPAGPREVLTSLADYEQFVRHIYSNYVTLLENTGHAIARAMDSYDPADMVKSVKQINTAAHPFSGESLYRAAGVVRKVVHPEHPGDIVHASPSYIGGRECLVVEKPLLHPDSLDEVTAVMTQTRVMMNIDSPEGHHESHEPVRPWSVMELKTAIREVEQLVDHLEKYRLSRVAERLASIQTYLTKSAGKVKEKAVDHQVLVGHALEYVAAYAVWSLNPISEVSASIQQIATQVMALVNANIRAYRPAA